MSTATTSRALRQRHRSEVLRRLLRDGDTTRGALVRQTGLSTATITNVITDLIDEGLVHEAGNLPSDGGRPKVRIAVRPEGAYFAGATVNERGVTVEIFDLSLTLLSAAFHPGQSDRIWPTEIASLLAAALDEALAAAGNPPLHSLGLGLPGVVEGSGDGAHALSLFAQSYGWPPTTLDAFVSGLDIPVYADNASKTLTTAERWVGSARGVSDALVALLGRGVGLGIVTSGSLMRGSHSSAGEWGHAKVSLDGPVCNCGARGCLEAYIGTIGIARRWRDAGGDPSADEEVAFLELLEAARAGDPTAAAVMDDTLRILGLGISNLVNLFNPTVVVISGFVGQHFSAAQLEVVEAHSRALSLDRPAQQFRVVAGSTPADAVALGAALLGVEQLILTPSTR